MTAQLCWRSHLALHNSKCDYRPSICVPVGGGGDGDGDRVCERDTAQGF
jgi:hypothetical protein